MRTTAHSKRDTLKPIVSTTVFHWFTPADGNLNGPWPPPEGRASWTGEKDWWIGQVKQIEALYELRSQGYDVPKVAPVL